MTETKLYDVTGLKVFEARRLSENLVGLVFNGLTRDFWTRATLRRPSSCWKCGRNLPKGEIAFRPVGNHVHRMRRVCVECIDQIVPLGEED